MTTSSPSSPSPSTLQYTVGDAPSIQIQIVEAVQDDSGNTVEYNPDVTGWTGVAVLTPRQSRVPTMVITLSAIDVGSGIFGFAITGGLLPGETPPNVAPVNSFSLPATYDCRCYVRTVNPDSSPGEVLSSDFFTIGVSSR